MFSKKIFLIAATSLLLSALISGCATAERPSDITLDELEKRMTAAMDPTGAYRNAYTYFQRQNIFEEGFFTDKHQLVEVRFKRPDNFKISYYDANKIKTEIISAGGRAWLIDHFDGIITEITGNALSKVKVMLALGHPDTDYDKLFDRVDMSLTTIEYNDVEYECYKLVCFPSIPKSFPIIIYIDRKTSLPRRMELQVKLPDEIIKSVSDIVEYKSFNNVKAPTLTKVTEGSREYDNRVVGYMLNVRFKNDEFTVPHFDPILMEMKKQQRRRR